MKVLILDDDEIRHTAFREWKPINADFHHVHTVDEAIFQLQSTLFDWIFLDHDLASKTEDGRTIARWIVKNITPLKYWPKICIHSWNYPATVEMLHILEEFDPVKFSFGTKEFRTFVKMVTS